MSYYSPPPPSISHSPPSFVWEIITLALQSLGYCCLFSHAAEKPSTKSPGKYSIRGGQHTPLPSSLPSFISFFVCFTFCFKHIKMEALPTIMKMWEKQTQRKDIIRAIISRPSLYQGTNYCAPPKTNLCSYPARKPVNHGVIKAPRDFYELLYVPQAWILNKRLHTQSC